MRPKYIHNESIHNRKAPNEVVPLILDLVNPKSIVDVGCGTGTWLKVFDEKGITDYLGVDGSNVDPKMLKIPIGKFYSHDLQDPINLHRKFDLVVSLEVAEHLHEKYANVFVETLSKLGDVILFSAAIPGQGGQNHLNEQWPEYWIEKFSNHGLYFHDIIRPLIWNNDQVDYWYKQNMFLILKNPSEDKIERYIHPELFQFKQKELENLNRSIKNGELGFRKNLDMLLKSIIRTVKK